jgi:transposase-like protein
MSRADADIDLFLHLLRKGMGSGRGLSAALRGLGVPRSTYYYWRRQLAAITASPVGVVRNLQQENRRLAKRVNRLEEDLVVAREALGKPWRRWPPGGPPSGGR